jgi:hypothetical protein
LARLMKARMDSPDAAGARAGRLAGRQPFDADGQWPDDVRLSDLESLFTRTAARKVLDGTLARLCGAPSEAQPRGPAMTASGTFET